MANLDTRPEVVNIAAYAGDTLTITITAPGSITDGMKWDAQVRSAAVTATFAITPPAVSGGPAFLVLESEITAALGADGLFQGLWDCQVSADGDDPVRTLVRGKLTIDPDVTRLL